MAQIHQPRGAITRQSTQLSKASSRTEGTWGNISVRTVDDSIAVSVDTLQFNHESSNEALRSPTSLGNASFGSGSLIRAPGKFQQSSGATDVLTEKSAESLDQLAEIEKAELLKLSSSKNSNDELVSIANHRAGKWLLDELTFIVNETLAKMKSKLGKEEQGQLYELSWTWRNRIQSVKDSSFRSSRRFDTSVLDDAITEEPDVQEVRKIQAELKTLDLLKYLVKIRKPEPTTFSLDSSIHMFLSTRGDVGPYTPEEELWEIFLLKDRGAREKKAVLQWLENCAQTDGTANFRTIIEELEKSAGIETGTWSHGFLHTRERLKSQKRKRQTDILQSSLLRNSENMEPLVTHLDPDVVGREAERNLEKADAFYDRALWLTCFAMMRQGIQWAEIREWCDEHNEGWRVGSFGMLADAQHSRTSLNGPEAGMLWRRMCLAQAQQPGIDPYQKAVYGLLAGDFTSVLPVCKTFDDIIYAKYNALLIQQFESFLKEELANPLPDTLRVSFPRLILPTDDESWNDNDLPTEIFGLRAANPSISDKEADDPFKLLQTSLIADDFANLVIQVGGIISDRANAVGRSKLIPREVGEVYDKSYTSLVDDHDALRTVIHITSIFKEVGYEFTIEYERYLNHIIVAYIDYMRLCGKIDLIPTYAVLIQDEHTKHLALGKVLVDITDRAEQTRFLHLISDANVNLGTVIIHAMWHAAKVLGFLDDAQMHLRRATRFKVLFIEPTDETQHWPGLRIKRDFKMEDITFGQERLVHAVEWFLAVPSLWQDTFHGVDKVMRWFLSCAWFGPALAVSKRIPYKALVAQKVGQYLPDEVVKGINPKRQKGEMFDLFNDDHVKYQTLDEQGKFLVDMLRGQARPLKELQELCLAVEQLVFWRDFENMVVTRNETRGEDAVDAPMKTELSSLLDEITEAVTPILKPDFLVGLQVNAEEQREFDDIKHKYTYPVLATYLSARYFAARYLGAEKLLPVYEVSVMLASPAAKDIAKEMVVYGDMSNVVLELGYISRLTLELSAQRDVDARIDEMSERQGVRKGAKEDTLNLDENFEKGDVSLADLYSYRRPKGQEGAENLEQERGWKEKGRFWNGEDVEMWDFTKVV